MKYLQHMRLTERLTGCLVQLLGLVDDWVRISSGWEKGGMEGGREGVRERGRERGREGGREG